MCDYVCARLGSCVLFQYNSFLQTLPMKALRSPQTQPSLNDPKNSYRINTGREQECPKIVSCCCPSHVLHPENTCIIWGRETHGSGIFSFVIKIGSTAICVLLNEPVAEHDCKCGEQGASQAIAIAIAENVTRNWQLSCSLHRTHDLLIIWSHKRFTVK